MFLPVLFVKFLNILYRPEHDLPVIGLQSEQATHS